MSHVQKADVSLKNSVP